MAIGTYAELKTAVANWLSRSDLTSRIPEFISMGEDRIGQDLRVRAMESTVDLVLGKVRTDTTVGGTANAITLTMGTTVSSLTLGLTVSWTATATNTSTVTLQVDSTTATALRKGDGTTALEANDIVNGSTYHAYYDGSVYRLGPRGSVPLPSRFVGIRRIYLNQDSKKLDYFAPSAFWTRNAVNETTQPKIFTIEGDHIVFAPQPDVQYFGKILYYRKFAALSSDADTNWLLANARGLLLYATLLEASPFIGKDSRALTWSTLYEDLLNRLNEADRKDRYPEGALVPTNEVGMV